MMMKPRQITPVELGKAYSKLRCEPCSMEWIDVEGRRCSPFVALLISARKMPARKVMELFEGQSFEFCCKQLTHDLNSHVSYVSGFELGFAMLTASEISALTLPSHLTDGEEFELGYADGLSCAKQFE